jgi:hypothetical protein
MDFDHRPDEVKLGSVGSFRKDRVALLSEAAKCDVVCSNCHRIRTSKRGASTKTRERLSTARLRLTPERRREITAEANRIRSAKARERRLARPQHEQDALARRYKRERELAQLRSMGLERPRRETNVQKAGALGISMPTFYRRQAREAR